MTKKIRGEVIKHGKTLPYVRRPESWELAVRIGTPFQELHRGFDTRRLPYLTCYRHLHGTRN